MEEVNELPFKNRFHIFFSVEPELKRKIVDLQLEHRGSPQAPFFKVFSDPKKFFLTKKKASSSLQSGARNIGK